MDETRAQLWRQAVEFHGHECPGLAIGARVALDYLASGRDRAEDEELAAVCETDACGVDAIQVLLGCTLGKGNLRLRNRGKHVFTLYSRPEGLGLRYYWKAYGLGGQSREERVRFFLSAPAEELYEAVPARQPPPPQAVIHKSVYCAQCGEHTAEPGIRLRQGRLVCRDCAASEAPALIQAPGEGTA